MSRFTVRCRVAAVAIFALAANGCSLFQHDAQSARPPVGVPATASATAPATAGSTSVAPASLPAWKPDVMRHLDSAALIGQTWTFPSASPQVYGDNRFVFKRDRVEASNAHEHVSGTWSVDGDKLCIVLNASAQGRACYYVTSASEGRLQILVLPSRERLPLQIR